MRKLIFLLMLFCGAAHATETIVSGYRANANGQLGYGTTIPGACAAVGGYMDGSWCMKAGVGVVDIEVRNICTPSNVPVPVNGVCVQPVDPAAACPAVGVEGFFGYQSAGYLSTLCVSGCSYTSMLAYEVGGIKASNASSDHAVCSTNTPGLTSVNTANPVSKCPSGTVHHGMDLSGTPICTGANAPPSCWVGSINVSTDPTIAICVGALPAAKDSETTAAAGAAAAAASAAAGAAAATKEAAAAEAVKSAGAAAVASSAAANAAVGAAAAAPADKAVADAAAAKAQQFADAAEASAAKALAAAKALGAGDGILPSGGGGGGVGGSDAGAGGSVMYEAGELTVSGVMTDFKNQIMTSPVIAAATGFFDVQAITGSCPSWVVSVAFMSFSYDLGNVFCSPMMTSLLQTVGVGFQLVGAAIGFSIAFL